MTKKVSKKRGGKRVGSGRKLKYLDSQVVSVKMPGKLAAAIDHEADRLKQSRNELIVDTLQHRFTHR